MSVRQERDPDLSGSVYYRGVTDNDWVRLHSRVVPNPLEMHAFKALVEEGKLHNHYLAKDLQKIMQEMRDILVEHGQIREAASFPLTGRKHALALAAAAAVHLLNNLPKRHSGGTTTHGDSFHVPLVASNEPPALVQAPTSWFAGGPLAYEGANGSANADPIGGAVSETCVGGPLSALTPIVPHATPSGHLVRIANPAELNCNASDPSVTGVGKRRRDSLEPPDDVLHASGTGCSTHSNGNRHWKALGPERASVIALNASIPRPLMPTSSPEMRATSTPAASGPSDAEARVELAVSSADEVSHFGCRCSPFFRILNITRRFQMRYGSHTVRFEVPVQYAAAVITRRLRVQIVPYRHPIIPARWPSAKEITVYVNDHCILTPWKRSWPDRKAEVAKTFLPLDVTQLLTRNTGCSQRLKMDVFNKEYLSQAALVVVEPLTLDEVQGRLLTDKFGIPEKTHIEDILLGKQRSSKESGATHAYQAIMRNDALVLDFYNGVMDTETDDGVEMDDPVISTKCPISQTPIEVPVRGASCWHLQCVDLTSYLVSGHNGCYWNCPLCDRELRMENIVVDTVLWRYLLHTQGNTPLHLRLSVNKSVPATSGPCDEVDHAGGQPSPGSRCCWYASRPHGCEDDVQVDSVDGDDGTADTTHLGRTPCDDPITDSVFHGGPGPTVSSDMAFDGHVQRAKTLSKSSLRAHGSADCPIEL